MPKTYAVKYERDEAGWWVAEAKAASAATQGRTIEQARERIREAIAASVNVAPDAVVLGREDIRLPPEQRRVLKVVGVAKAKAEKQNAAAEKAVRDAALKLTKSGISLRDAGELLGMTRQRVHQLVSG